jgi:hypothetical protein
MLGIGLIEEIVVLLIILAEIAIDIAVIAHVSKHQRSTLTKLTFIAIIVVFPFLGALYYIYWAGLYRRSQPQDAKE